MAFLRHHNNLNLRLPCDMLLINYKTTDSQITPQGNLCFIPFNTFKIVIEPTTVFYGNIVATLSSKAVQ